MPKLPRSVDPGSSLPIDNVNQLPGKPNEVVLQLPLLIDRQLGFRVEGARAFRLILVINVELTDRQIVGSRSAIVEDLAESEKAVGNKANLPPSGGWDLLDVADVIAEGARDCDVSHCLHLGERVEQPLILAVPERLVQDLFVCLTGEFINGQRHREFLSHLRVSASGSGFN